MGPKKRETLDSTQVTFATLNGDRITTAVRAGDPAPRRPKAEVVLAFDEEDGMWRGHLRGRKSGYSADDPSKIERRIRKDVAVEHGVRSPDVELISHYVTPDALLEPERNHENSKQSLARIERELHKARQRVRELEHLRAAERLKGKGIRARIVEIGKTLGMPQKQVADLIGIDNVTLHREMQEMAELEAARHGKR